MVFSLKELIFYHLPNYFLSVLFWTLLGRFVLMFLVSKNPTNYIFLFFCRLTDWYLKLINPITPKFIPPFLLPFYAIFFLILARFVLWIIAYKLGIAPKNVLAS